MNPTRGLVTVTPVDTEETMPGGAIILTEDTRKRYTVHQMRVVAVGLPAICDDEDCGRPHETFDGDTVHPIDSRIAPDAWVIVRHRSLVPAGQDSDRLSVVLQDDVLGVFTVGPEAG